MRAMELDFHHVHIFLAIIMMYDRVCVAVNVARTPDGKPPQLPVIISRLPAGSGGFIRFYTSPWKRMVFRKNSGGRRAIAIVIECRWRPAK